LASQLRFEGPELETLLEQVRDEVGGDARIVEANRIRKGGVGGFFAKEHFEVLVEEPIDPVVAGGRNDARPGPARAPASILDLADQVNDAERQTSADGDEGPAVSTETDDFNAMLARLTAQFEERRLFEQRGNVLAPPADPVVLDDDERSDDPVVIDDLPVIDRPKAVMPEPAPIPVGPALMSPSPRAASPAGPPVATAAAPRPVPAPAASPTESTRIERTLERLGLPNDLVPEHATDAGLRSALLESLSRLPVAPAPPDTPGVVVAVVGDGTAPARLARRLATDLEIDLEHIELSTPRQGCDLAAPAAAAERRLSWRRRPRPTIVVVSTGTSRRELAWARAILDHLEPTIVWAVADASCKPMDVGDRLARLGGVDALALVGVENTVSPASVLTLGVPVGRLDGQVATPLSWTELLMERMPPRPEQRAAGTPGWK
jgi:hypothetical protein